MRFFLQWPNQHKGIKNLRKVAELIQPGRILESKGMRAIFHKKGKKRAKKGKILENLGINVQNLKIF